MNRLYYNIPAVPEIKVNHCILHKNPSIDSQLDKLSNVLEVRLRHKGCSKQHCLRPGYGEATLGKILYLKQSSNSHMDKSNFVSLKNDDNFSFRNASNNPSYSQNLSYDGIYFIIELIYKFI